jgi:hypothetical protein
MIWHSLQDALPVVLKALSGFALAALGKYHKEIQDFLIELGKRWWGFWLHRHDGRRVSDSELQTILDSGLVGLETLLYYLLREYKADRVTVTEFEEKDGSRWATCVVEVRQAEMQSVERQVQQMKVTPELWDEMVRIHNRPDRSLFVLDARAVDVAAMRAALLESGVWSAYYQSLPTSQGKPRAMLALSWHLEHLPTEVELRQLKFSGVACAAVLLSMAPWKPTGKT